MPGGVCAVAVLTLRRLLPSAAGLTGMPALLGVGCGYIAAQLGIAGLPRLPPVDSTQAIIFVVVTAVVLGCTALRPVVLPAQHLALRAASVGLLLWLTLRPVVRYQWGRLEAVLWLGGLGVLLLLLWEGYVRVASRLSPRSSLAGWIAALAGTGIVLALSSTALFAQLAFVLVATLVVLLLLTRSADRPALEAALPVLVVLLAAFVLNGSFYAELSAARALALAVSPLGAAAGLAFRRQVDGRALLSAALAVVGVLLIVAPVLGLAALDWFAAGEAYSDY